MRKLRLGLYDGKGELLPRVYSSGKSQLDAIEEILEAFESSDIVFFKGVVGSGKSVVGIRTALEFGRGIVSVPTKVLSDQYTRSYEREKYFVKFNGSRAKLGVLKGRGNFPCLYLRDKGREGTAAWKGLPCRRPLKKSAGERRSDALKDCKHWGFLFPKSYGNKIEDVEKLPYAGVSGEWLLCLRGECPYWKQFTAYVEADVTIMNSAKWMSEVIIGRIPKVPITVVDEADEWLDSLALKTVISEKHLEKVAEFLHGHEESRKELKSFWDEVLKGNADPIEFAMFFSGLLEELDETGDDLLWKLKVVIEHREWVEFETRENSILFLVPDPRPVFRKIFDRLECKWLLMSATIQSNSVLREIFGIEPMIVEGETKFPGILVRRRTGSEVVVRHENWVRDEFREKYWKCLYKIFELAEKPSFIPVHAFKYLPTELAERLRNSSEDMVELENIFLSSKMDRGADLKGMRSIIILKFPFPEVEDPLLRGMKKRLGDKAFWLYYRDMADRSFVQQIGRVLRSPHDRAEFWSPDLICHEMLRRVWKGEIIEE